MKIFLLRTSANQHPAPASEVVRLVHRPRSRPRSGHHSGAAGMTVTESLARSYLYHKIGRLCIYKSIMRTAQWCQMNI